MRYWWVNQNRTFKAEVLGGVLAIFKKWLGYVSREIETPDLWETLSNERELVNSIAE
jgi:hypothetical protein